MNKKAAIEMEKVVAAALVLLVLVVLIITFSRLYGKETKTTESQIDKLSSDCDGDGTPDLVDKCPYDEDNEIKDNKCVVTQKPADCP